MQKISVTHSKPTDTSPSSTSTTDNFWQQLPQPFIGLAPMDGITDQPFRHLVAKYGQPDVICTEFTNVEGLCHGAAVLLRQLLYDASQRPIIAQVYGKTPAAFRQVAVLVAELGFDGIDINMGCPARTVASHGSGAALIQQPKLAQEIITATQAGVQDWVNGKTSRDCTDFKPVIWQEVEARRSRIKNHCFKDQRVKNPPIKNQLHQAIPISIKTRIGHDQAIISDWLPILLATQPAAIAIHGRTLKQGYSGQADWSAIGQAAELAVKSNSQSNGQRNNQSSNTHKQQTLIIGNGDVHSRQEAVEKAQQYGVAGVLIGRAAMGNPLVFQDRAITTHAPNLFHIALEHAQLYESTFQDQVKYSFLPMRKHLAWYIKGISNAKEIRQALVQTYNSQEVAEIFHRYNLI